MFKATLKKSLGKQRIAHNPRERFNSTLVVMRLIEVAFDPFQGLDRLVHSISHSLGTLTLEKS